MTVRAEIKDGLGGGRVASVTEQNALLVSESGLFLRKDLDRVQSAGAGAVLVGEALMRQDDIQAAIESLIKG